jgi:carboxymethylenebutenolidase
MEIVNNSGLGAEHVRAGTEFLSVRQRAPKVGVLGWCFGGGWALQTALLEPDRINAAVMYYGRPITDPGRLAALRAPVLGLFGAEDRGIPVALVREMETALRSQSKEVTVQVYEGAGHAFANPSGESYRAAAADDAWARTTAFFAQHLRAGM